MLDGQAILSAVRAQDGTITDFRFDYVNDVGCRTPMVIHGVLPPDTPERLQRAVPDGTAPAAWAVGFVRPRRGHRDAGGGGDDGVCAARYRGVCAATRTL